MKIIKKIILHNFKRFRHVEIPCNETLNIFIGDNEAGKSTILQAIDIVSRGSLRRVEDIGLNRLINADAIREFTNEGNRDYNSLPEMYVELFFSETNDRQLNGRNNSEQRVCDGIRMLCKPDDNYSAIIRNVLLAPEFVFPFEFYKIDFETFAGESYNGHTRKHGTLAIDNFNITNPYAAGEYVRTLYYAQTTNEQRLQFKHTYHQAKEKFAKDILREFHPGGDEVSAFSIKDNSTDNLETAISLQYNGVPIENKGTGQLCFIKTELALRNVSESVDAILLEEPENHLSYGKMLQLIHQIQETMDKQLFISTHSDMVTTRLDLRKCTMLSCNSQLPVQFKDISEDTAKFFMKAPDNNMLQFVLARKAILVEGDAEYILMERFVSEIVGQSLEQSGIAVIAVDGRCFKRYLEIAKLLRIKTAVITDNDRDYNTNITQNYAEYIGQYPYICIFSDSNNDLYTFEACMYNVNKVVCDRLFAGALRSRTVLDYMLDNKSEVAYRLLITEAPVAIPQYIINAIQWLMS